MTQRRSAVIYALSYAVPALLALSGCGDGEPLSPQDLIGSYTLVQAAGADLPAVIESTDSIVTEVTGGQLSLSADGQYTLSVDLQSVLTNDPSNLVLRTSFRDFGPYVVKSSTLALQSSAPGKMWVGTVARSSISLDISVPNVQAPLRRFTFQK